MIDFEVAFDEAGESPSSIRTTSRRMSWNAVSVLPVLVVRKSTMQSTRG